jgi:dolichol-phosphate mannosyltransferase
MGGVGTQCPAAICRKESMELAIIMPTYNEAECIADVVSAWMTVVTKLDAVLIVVNDGSRDHTGKILDQLAVRYPQLRVIHQANGGHGAAVLRGYQEAIALRATWTFQTDSDGQISETDFWALWKDRGRAGFVLGIRANRQDPPLRLLISTVCRALNRILFGVSIRDLNVPYRLMNTRLLAELMPRLPPKVFAPNVFLSVLFEKSNVPVVQIEINHRPRTTGQVSIFGWKLAQTCVRCANELIRFRFSFRRFREISVNWEADAKLTDPTAEANCARQKK